MLAGIPLHVLNSCAQQALHVLAAAQEVLKSGGRCSRLHSHPYIYMRWKERFFVKGSESRLTIAGFYYVCINRCVGVQMEGQGGGGPGCVGCSWCARGCCCSVKQYSKKVEV